MKSTGVHVPANKINKVVEHGDALVGHPGSVSCSETPPLPPAWVKHLKQVIGVCEGAGTKHSPEAQYAVESGPRLGERSLEDRLQELLLVVTQCN